MRDTFKSLAALQDQWVTLYRDILPALAKARDPCQPRWPVVLDHCFARIILDNAVGIDRPWADTVKAPAVKHMTREQLVGAIELGEMIATGERDLVELDGRSLGLRGKAGKGKRKSNDAGDLGPDASFAERSETPRKKSRKGEMADVWAMFMASKHGAIAKESTLTTAKGGIREQSLTDELPDSHKTALVDDADALAAIRIRIASDQSMTLFRRRVLTLLTQVPRGHYTTYKALSVAMTSQAPCDEGFLGSTPSSTSAIRTSKRPSSTSCARAVGSAMRKNPFAPLVPCHRVLAADGKIGGFGGDWGEEGRFASEKLKLLRDEGLKFDGRGKVVGEPFVEFLPLELL